VDKESNKFSCVLVYFSFVSQFSVCRGADTVRRFAAGFEKQVVYWNSLKHLVAVKLL